MNSVTSVNVNDWDAAALLGTINPYNNQLTCVGQTKQGRRCRNAVARHNQDAAQSILLRLPEICTDDEELKAQLEQLAELTLCRRWHANDEAQVKSITRIWHRTIRDEVRRREHAMEDSRMQQEQSLPIRVPAQTEEQLIATEQLERLMTLFRSLEEILATTSNNSPARTRSPVGSIDAVDNNVRQAQSLSTPRTQRRAQNAEEQARDEGASVERQQDPSNLDERQQSGSEECPICYEGRTDTTTTACGHTFCTTCITSWLERTNTCPSCRTDLSAAQHPADHDEEESCSICREPREETVRTPCGHLFCRSCITTWLDQSVTCPMCRAITFVDELTRV